MATEQLGERVSRLEGGYEHVATKAGVAEVRAEVSQMEARLAEFRGEVNSRFAEIDTKFAKMEAKIAQMENRITLRLGALFIAISGALFAALRLLE